MILERLAEYADSLDDIPPPAYQEQPIRYIFELDHDGRLLEISDTKNPEEKSTRRGTVRLAPHVKRAQGIRPKLLADNATYAIGLSDPAKSQSDSRIEQQHRAFVDLVDQASASISHPAVQAVRQFLYELDLNSLEIPEDFAAGENITFRVDGDLPIDLPEIRQFWAEASSEKSNEGPVLPCIVCGQERPALARHPLKVKGIRVGQSSGTDLISANEPVFESYGLDNSLIAPTCAQCAEKYGNGLNALLANPRTHLHVAGVEYVFWPAKPVGFNPSALLSEPKPEEVKELYKAVQMGRASATELHAVGYYAMALGASGSRAAILSWLDTSVSEAQRSLARWFFWQELVAIDGADGDPLSAWRIASSTVRDPKKEKPSPVIPTALIHTAFTGAPLPIQLLDQVVRRNRAEQGVTRPRAALIKLVLCSQQGMSDQERQNMTELNSENTNPAYLCGRLLAVLETIQRRALSSPNTTIVDRYYGSASSAPASVFGTLLHGAQPHLSKMQKSPQTKGASMALSQRLEEVLAGLKEFPATLTLQDQGLFALGFYHQKAADRKAAREHRELRLDPTIDEDSPTETV